MPFYEYQCQACGEKIEELQKVNDPPLLQCATCGRETLQRVVSLTGFQLTGTGWYETDFKDKKPQPVVETETKTTAGTQPEKTGDSKIVDKVAEKPKEKTLETKAKKDAIKKE